MSNIHLFYKHIIYFFKCLKKTLIKVYNSIRVPKPLNYYKKYNHVIEILIFVTDVNIIAYIDALVCLFWIILKCQVSGTHWYTTTVTFS